MYTKEHRHKDTQRPCAEGVQTREDFGSSVGLAAERTQKKAIFNLLHQLVAVAVATAAVPDATAAVKTAVGARTSIVIVATVVAVVAVVAVFVVVVVATVVATVGVVAFTKRCVVGHIFVDYLWIIKLMSDLLVWNSKCK